MNTLPNESAMHQSPAREDTMKTAELYAAIDAFDRENSTFRDMIYLAQEHGVKTSTVAALIEHRDLLTH